MEGCIGVCMRGGLLLKKRYEDDREKKKMTERREKEKQRVGIDKGSSPHISLTSCHILTSTFLSL